MIKVKKFIEKYRVRVLGLKFYVRRHFEELVAANYARHLQRLGQKLGQEKIRVGFLVRENVKWSYESLYHLLEADPDFEPLVLIKDEKMELCSVEKNCEFFRHYRHCVIRELADYVAQRVDILFYEQPWFDMFGDFTPDAVSEHSLTCYVSYALEPEVEPEIIQETQYFCKALHRSFAFNERICQEMEEYGIHNACAVGHPRMDAYLKPEATEVPWRSEGKVRIIYAPHHSFGHSVLKQSSWEWSGEHLLRLAQQSQGTTEWILKPHPRFQYELGRLLKSEQKAQEVMDAWAEVSCLYDRGNYFDLFKTADLMISDCLSFNIEWLPTRKPFIRLHSRYADARPFPGVDHYAEHYYHARTTAEIDRWFDMLVNRREDPALEARSLRAQEVHVGVAADILEMMRAELRAAAPGQG